MDSYVAEFQAAGGSLVMLAKGNRGMQVTNACKKHGGFYLGSIGGPAAILAKDTRTDVGSLVSLDLSRRGVSGRLIRVTITGSLGTKAVSGEVFRSVFNVGRPLTDSPLRGTLFDVQPIP